MDFAYVLTLLPAFLVKLPYTLAIVAGCYAVAFVLAFLILRARVDRIPVLSAILDVYVSFVRCEPIVLLLFLIYFGLPQLLGNFGIDITSLTKTTFACVTLVFFNAGWLSEILRGAYLSVTPDQFELADSLGYTKGQLWRHTLLPQIVGIAIPDLGNAAVDLLKDTSLLFTIGVVDMMGLASIKVANNYGVKQSEVYLAVALIYWVAALVIEAVVHLAKRSNRYYRVVDEASRARLAADAA